MNRSDGGFVPQEVLDRVRVGSTPRASSFALTYRPSYRDRVAMMDERGVAVSYMIADHRASSSSVREGRLRFESSRTCSVEFEKQGRIK